MSAKWVRGCKDYVLISGGEASWRVALVRNGVTANLGRYTEESVAQEVAAKTEVPVLDRSVRCVHCGDLNFDYFMVIDEVWRESGVLAGRVHFSCLEERIKRPLVIADFTHFPVNSAIWFGYSLGRSDSPMTQER